MQDREFVFALYLLCYVVGRREVGLLEVGTIDSRNQCGMSRLGGEWSPEAVEKVEMLGRDGREQRGNTVVTRLQSDNEDDLYSREAWIMKRNEVE